MHHADVANWVDLQSERKLLKKFNAICEESLSPEAMELWYVIQSQLKSVRKNL